MTDFMLIFRNDSGSEFEQTPQEAEAIMKKWMDWMGSMAAQNKLADKGNRLGNKGVTARPGNMITDGPYTEIKEIVGGYIVVRAGSLEEAAEMSKGCPILERGGCVEVRNVISMDGKQ